MAGAGGDAQRPGDGEGSPSTASAGPDDGHAVATRIVAVRHGETDWNVGARVQGHTDIALNAHGRWQAQRLAEALAGEPFAAVYASDLARAHDTAAPLAARTAAPLRRHAGLRERSLGVFEGLDHDEIARRWPEQALAWRRREPQFGPAGGETLVAFHARCVAVLLELAARHPGEQIALVTHGGVLDSYYRVAAGVELQTPRTWRVANATINRLLAAGGRVTLVGWADGAHLERDVAPDTGAALDESNA
jgi:probable phosphoglycerate mutase